ncbi:hypothetical protein R0V13_01300 [Facklamia hominis]|uniref:hypothetical protein n=1 Tax=Facklamia hominis TaxID=178214 RepID=UPI0029D41A48|nr:hypothetical protein [Facklamia hominis]WPJ91054.1 hypothetical protein R0V13_01300 [Facklamia hominis]
MFKLCVSYEAKSLDEVKALLEMSKNNQVVEVAIKEPEQLPIEEVPEETKEPAKEVEKSKENTEEEVDFTLEDLQKLAVQANKEGNLSKVKEVLEKHGIERISKTPQDKLAEIGQELKGLI